MNLKQGRLFAKYVEDIFGVESQADWYRLTYTSIKRYDKVGVIASFGNVHALLEAVYPQFLWYPWKFKYCPKTFWQKRENVKRFYDWLGEEIGIKKQSDWYSVDVETLRNSGGMSLIVTQGFIPSLEFAYPHLLWSRSKENKPAFYWNLMYNQRRFMDRISEILGMESLSGWYEVKHNFIYQHGGGSLLQLKYNSSLIKALQHIYPEYDWEPWKFGCCPRNFWNKDENIRKFLDWVAEKLEIRDPSDWYKLTTQKLIHLGGKALLIKCGSIGNVYSLLFPGNCQFLEFNFWLWFSLI
jgi:hypothetical protein